jgi:hypothetical protein
MATGVLLGVLLGGGIVWVAMSKTPPKRYVLTKDLNTEEMYFFSPKSTVPVKAVVKAGSEFEVDGRYSSADYIVFRTVVDRQQLVAMSTPAPPESPRKKQ